MRIALLGLPGAGKTTVFNAVAGRQVPEPAAGFQTEVHVQVVVVPDARLEHCRALFQPKKYTPAGMELHDPPGIPEGSEAQAVDRRGRLLSTLREADAYVVVLRDFASPRYPYARPEPDPAADLARLGDLLLTSDYVILEGRAQKLRESIQRKAKTQDLDRVELQVVERVLARLEAGRHATDLELGDSDAKRLRGFQLFSRKPFLLLLSGPARAVPETLGTGFPMDVRGRLVLDGQIEAEVAAMAPADRGAFLEEFGIGEPAAARFVQAVYAGVGLRSFFTVGEDEVRAWTIPAGATALEAAGTIHTDLARGFVRAEVFAYDDLAAAGDLRTLKARGGLRLESRDYVVKDGEIVHIRSAV